jgi:signal transduction histidine kinase
MIVPAIPENEAERLAALEEYHIVDTLPERDYDELTMLASHICDAPISLISIIDETRQWFKSHQGLEATETPREVAFCAHAILKPDEVLIVNDSREDERFKGNILVSGPPHVIFYAGVPLVTPHGFPLGTLCVIDSTPRHLNEKQIEALIAISHQVTNLLEARKNNIMLEKFKQNLEVRNENLQKFVSIAAHDIKSPLVNIISLADILKKTINEKDDTASQCVELIHQSANRLREMVNGILEYYRGDIMTTPQDKQEVELLPFLKSIIKMLPIPPETEVRLPQNNCNISIYKKVVERILINLITNSLKYNDKEKPLIEIEFEKSKEYHTWQIADNGMGIRKEHQEKLFNLFVNFGKKDRFGNVGSGMGLASVKKLVEDYGGTISLTSIEGEGTTVKFEFPIN